MLAALTTVTAICMFAVVYPYVIYPLILSCLSSRAVNSRQAGSEDGAAFSLCFCAYNEITAMCSKVQNLRVLKDRYPSLEILAYDDGSGDGTADAIEKDAPFVRLIRGRGRSGKAHGMKQLAALATGDILIFTDANVLLDSSAPDALAACFADPCVGGVCGTLRYLGGGASSTAAVGGAYWRLEELIKDLESATGSVMGADGSIFAIRRSLYPDFPDTVLDDFAVSMEVVFKGYRLTKSNDVIAYERLVSARSDEFARKIRIAARAFHTHVSLADRRSRLSLFDRFKYASHKTLRWFGGAFLLLGFVTGLSAVAVISPWLSAAVFFVVVGMLSIGIRSEKGVLSAMAEIVLAMIATLIGVVRALRGQTFVTWNPAKSR